VSVYLDSSVVVPLFVADSFVLKARAILRALPISLTVSDFVAAEFASVLRNRLRAKSTRIGRCQTTRLHLDTRMARVATRIETRSADVRDAGGILRRFDPKMRTSDALNIAIAQRAGAELATFDRRLSSRAYFLCVRVVSL
jgi:uncharacterized protein